MSLGNKLQEIQQSVHVFIFFELKCNKTWLEALLSMLYEIRSNYKKHKDQNASEFIWHTEIM